MVEFALVVGIFVMVLYGLIYFGMALATKQRVTNAAAEGARAAVGQTSATAAGVATTRVNALLGGTAKGYTIGPDPTGPRVGPCDPAVPAGAQCVTVTITWDWAGHPVVPAAPGLRIFPINNLGSTAVVQYSS
jgi:Flp pilus assembly protein TadG